LQIPRLTIRSREDVQPYTALCKALKKDGHTCRISSHGKYKTWIEGYGNECVENRGDPAELMKVCVDNCWHIFLALCSSVESNYLI
ncbi:hypothetical protein BY996DRAFT_4563411, partial [Phakopsora pachyrhizi]